MESTLQEFHAFLRKNYNNAIFHSHVSLISPKGCFQFNRQGLEEFWKMYNNLVYTKHEGYDTHKHIPVLGIAEKPQQYLPILADIDIKIKDNDDIIIIDDKLYTEEQVKGVIQVYQSILRKIINNCTDKHLICVLLEKNLYTDVRNEITYLKNGFHLHFPYCFMDKKDQELHLIPRVKETLKEMKLFNNYFEDSGDVIDSACCKVPWLLYGSRKKENAEPYIITKIFNSEMEELSLREAFEEYNIFDHKEHLIKYTQDIKYYLPRILSIIPYNRPVCETRPGLLFPTKEKMKAKQRKEKKTYDQHTLKENINILKKLLPLLADHRADDHNERMTIGWAIFNITDGSTEGLDLWCNFASRCPEKYDEGKCIHRWERMVKKDITMGTIKHYAKIDSPEEYKKFKKEQTEKHIVNSLQGSHNDIAKALYSEYGDEFVCASISNKLWYQFIGHTWKKIEEGIFLRRKISDALIYRFSEAGKELFEKKAVSDDKAEGEMIDNRIKMVQKMMGNLKNSSFKTNCMKEAMEVFYDERFREKLDMDPWLIAFQNGVYDLRLNIFRAGRPEDFLSKSMSADYVEYTEDSEKVHEMRLFLEQVFPDKSVRKYFLDTASDVFVGGNHQKIVLFWSGEGDNGKSVTQSFFENLLGKLSIKFNTTVITGKKPNSGSANADLARAGGGIRWAVVEEPDGDEMINVGVLKHLSGNDSFYARDLFERGKDGREIVPLFKLVVICNKLPKIKYADKATWNRIRVIPFEATFCRPGNPAPDTYEEQLRQKRFPMDPKFALKIPGLVSAFAWILLRHRIQIIGKPREEPEKVKIATSIYQKQNDIYRQFYEEHIVEDESKSITLMELYARFKEWFRESMPNHSTPPRNDIEEYFAKLWGTPEKGKKWLGYRSRTTQDDNELDEDIVFEIEDEENEEEHKNNLPDF